MAYQIIDPTADAAIHVLPAEARPALGEVMTVLSVVPWNGNPINKDNPDAEVYTLHFGPGPDHFPVLATGRYTASTCWALQSSVVVTRRLK